MSDTITYAYSTPSSLVKGQQGDELFLANYSEVQKKVNPCFFWGRLKDPHTTARCIMRNFYSLGTALEYCRYLFKFGTI
ncbi:MAG: hypothetical protein WBP58_15175 [Chitinophagaceae bacterium]